MEKNNKSFISRFHIVPKLICVLFAFIIWIYVMTVDSPDNEEVFEDVPVTIMGTTALENERNLSIFSGYDALVDVTVRGQKSVISKYSSEDIVATVDVSKITEGGMYNLELFFDLVGDQVRITHLRKGRNDNDLFLCTGDRPLQIFTVHGQIDHCFHSHSFLLIFWVTSN